MVVRTSPVEQLAVDSIDTIARHVIGTRFADLPEDAVEATCKFILDTLGVGIFGSSGPWVEELISAQGGPPTSGVACVCQISNAQHCVGCAV